MEIVTLFPTTVYKNNIINDFTEDCIDNLKGEEYIRTPLDNGWITKKLDLHKDDKYNDLFGAIDYHVNYFAKEILKIKDDIDLVCMSSWVTMNIGSDYAQDHIHASSMISGVLYLDAPPGSAPINFHGDINKNNTFGTFFPIQYSEFNQLNSNTYRVDVESGIMVLFPSSLRHSVRPNSDSSIKRYVLSFDYIPVGVLNAGPTKISLNVL
tara:strand:+ start:6962 stop:7591 length:630 start_codon:yes stop_codon:yes gene_type:complete